MNQLKKICIISGYQFHILFSNKKLIYLSWTLNNNSEIWGIFKFPDFRSKMAKTLGEGVIPLSETSRWEYYPLYLPLSNAPASRDAQQSTVQP